MCALRQFIQAGQYQLVLSFFTRVQIRQDFVESSFYKRQCFQKIKFLNTVFFWEVVVLLDPLIVAQASQWIELEGFHSQSQFWGSEIWRCFSQFERLKDIRSCVDLRRLFYRFHNMKIIRSRMFYQKNNLNSQFATKHLFSKRFSPVESNTLRLTQQTD